MKMNKEVYFIKTKMFFVWCNKTKTYYYDWYKEDFVENSRHLPLTKLYTFWLSEDDADRILKKLRIEQNYNEQILKNIRIIKRKV